MPGSGITDWRNFAEVYGRLGPPLRPSPNDVDNFRRAIASHESRVLLLGVTPELAALGETLTAVDNSPKMLARIWPGNAARQQAILGDWTCLPFGDGSFDAAIGDGSLNSAPEFVRPILAEVRRVLAPGGRTAFRCFCAPEEPETLEAISADCERGSHGNFHALKWRIAMALAADEPDAIVPVSRILETFDSLFPDRERLAALTGWSMDEITTIDAYSGAGHSLGFPTERALTELGLQYFARADVLPGDGYPLSERCPTIGWSAESLD